MQTTMTQPLHFSPQSYTLTYVLRAPLLVGLALMGCQREQGTLALSPTLELEERDHLRAQSVAQTGALLDSETCAYCHPRQASEFEGSTMRYGFSSPVFNALELALNQLSEASEGYARFAEGGAAEGFCSGCHSPQATQEGLVVSARQASAERVAEPERRGLTCETCHVPHDELSPAQALTPSPNVLKVGPSAPGPANPFHGLLRGERGAQARGALRNGELCGACHDVRPDRPDIVTGEARLRSEDLFSEWARSPWADPSHPQNPMRGRAGITGLHEGQEEEGEQVTCNDCHMSLYPERGLDASVSLERDFSGVDPATLTRKLDKLYASGHAARAPALLGELTRSLSSGEPLWTPEGELSSSSIEELLRRMEAPRRVSSHRFTGVSRPLNHFPRAPILPELLRSPDGPLADESDPAWRERGREALLKAALSLTLVAPTAPLERGRSLRVDAWLENIGAGHNVPAGFSQERELWVELSVEDLGRPCRQHQECEDLLEPRLFLDDPNRWCHPRGPTGEPDPSTPLSGSWELARRQERSGRCSEAGRCLLYRSGHLVDHDGDGRLNDEDLRHQLIELNPETLSEVCVQAGPDADLRLSGVERGLVYFTNSLQRLEVGEGDKPIEHPRFAPLAPLSEPYQAEGPAAWALPIWAQPQADRRSLYPTERARYERVRYRPSSLGPLLGLGPDTPTLLHANHAFNGQALRPFEPRLARYDVPWRDGIVGPLQVSARVRFRFLSPRLLRALAARSPELISEEMIDERLTIIDMATSVQRYELTSP